MVLVKSICVKLSYLFFLLGYFLQLSKINEIGHKRSIFAAVFSLIISNTYAACTSPSGIAGAIEFNSSTQMYDYCNDTRWVPLNSEGIIEASTLIDPDQAINSPYRAIPSGNYVYVFSSNPKAIFTVDITDKKNPNVVASLSISPSSSIVTTDGNFLYAVSGTTAYIYNIATPTAITLEGSVTDSNINASMEIDVSGDYLYTGGSSDRFTIIDISNKASPIVSGSVYHATELSNMRSIVVKGDYAYVVTDNNRLTTIDVTSKSSPSITNSILDSTNLRDVNDVEYKDNYLYVTAKGNSSANGFFSIYDITTPSIPNYKKTLDVIEAKYLEIQGDRAYISTYLNGCSLFTYDISDRENPVSIFSQKISCFGLESMNSDVNTIAAIQNSEVYIIDIEPYSVIQEAPSTELFDPNITNSADVGVSGNIAVSVSSSQAVVVYDISTPSNINVLSRIYSPTTTNNYSKAAAFDGNYVYVNGVNHSAIWIHDATVPSDIKFVTSIYDSDLWYGNQLIISGTELYQVGNSGFVIVDISVPVVAGILSSITTLGSLDGVGISGNYAIATNAAGDNVYVIDITNKLAPVVIATFNDPVNLDAPRGVAVDGNYAYITGYNKLVTLDISTPTAPVIVGEISSTNVGTSTSRIKKIGNTLHLSNGKIFDVTNPLAPSYIGNGPGASGMAVSGNTLVTTANSQAIATYDISTPTSPVSLDTESYFGKIANSVDVTGYGNYAFVLSKGAGAIQVFDVTDSKNISNVATYAAAKYSSGIKLFLVGTDLYVLSNNTLTILDVTNPLAISQRGEVVNANLSGALSIRVVGNYAYVGANNKITVIDVTNKSAPSYLTNLSDILLANCTDMDFDASYLYVGCGTSTNFVIVDITTPASPYIYGSVSSSTHLTNINGVGVVGNYAYISASSGLGGAIIDMTDKANPVIVKQFFPYNTSSSSPLAVHASGNRLFTSHGINYGVPEYSTDIPVDPQTVGKGLAAYMPSELFKSGNRLLSIGQNVFHVWDLAPIPLARISKIYNTQNIFSSVNQIAIDGNRAYVARAGVLIVLDITDINNPLILGKLNSAKFSSGPLKIAASGDFVYLVNPATSERTFSIVNVQNPAEMFITYNSSSWWAYSSDYRDMKVVGNRWYYLRSASLTVLDISSSFDVTNIGSTSTNLTSGSRLIIDGNYAYVCQSSSNVFLIYDISNPGAITLQSQTPNALFNSCRDIVKNGDTVIVGNSLGEISFVDVSDVFAPSVTNSFSDPSLAALNNLHYDNNSLLVSKGSNLILLDVTDPANVIINQNLAKGDSTSLNQGDQLFESFNGNFISFNFKKLSNLGACTDEGSIRYNSTHNVFNFCKNSFLVPLGPFPGAGGAGCSAPVAPVGSLNYNSTINKYQFCDGNSWVTIE